MLFNSIAFIIFFPLVVGLYFTLPRRYRHLFLLAASYYFYMCWKVEYVVLIFISTSIDYWAGIQIGKSVTPERKKRFLVLSLVCNLGILFGFKYFNFANENLDALFNYFNIFYEVPAFQLLLPVGISFYTFQTLSYTIDVYRGNKEPEYHFTKYALYVAFFPQLVAGPIERSSHLLAQFYQPSRFDPDRAASGLRRMLWGFFKKLVIADRLAVYVNEIYLNPGQYEGGPVLLATYFFAFQIYCDFSGYSDIAIGAAKVLGIDLRENFRRPYFATSIREFWQRWHISLTTWFRDYLYIPLGGNRVPRWRWYYNIVLVFVISGLWHGAQWTFLVWGLLHGFYFLCSVWLRPVRNRFERILRLERMPRIYNGIRICFIFHLVLLAWVFFRACCISDACLLIKSIFTCANWSPAVLSSVALGNMELAIVGLAILFMEFVQALQGDRPLDALLESKPRWFRWWIYYAISFSILMVGKTGQQEFIYFQF